MKNLTPPSQDIKSGLHPRNRHNSRYDFESLIRSIPHLANYITKNKYGDESLDFSNPEAVKTLNQALLKHFYNISHWDIPQGHLCPPIPGRADYIHQIADLLASNNSGIIPKGKNIRVLDIGVGANCVYPLIAQSEYGWFVVGTDIDPVAIQSSTQIIISNQLNDLIEIRHQTLKNNIFKGIIQEKDLFAVTISNPPFHSSLAEAESGNQRKNKNLGKEKNSRKKPALNFGGVSNELWCEGGEVEFITKMIKESAAFKMQSIWFSSLVSKYTNLPRIYDELKYCGVKDFKTIDMAQGQKKSRIVAWTFQDPRQINQSRDKE